MSHGKTEMVKVAIAIPTFRRPDRLSKLLHSLPPRISECTAAVVEVVVVDNDPNASAREAAQFDSLPVRYVVEATPGIAAARNRLLTEASGSDLVAFIDDDEIPRPGWLSSLIDVWRSHRSAAVMGRVISVFDDDVDPWILASKTFHRPPRQTGLSLQVAAAGNLLVDMAQVEKLGLSFDANLGLAGSEDTLFSRQLVERGGSIVWCNESETEDFVVASRLTRRWVEQRAFSSANGWTRVDLMLEPSSLGRLKLRSKYLVGGIARIALGYGGHLYGRTRRDLTCDARGVRLLHRGRGMVAASVGRHYEEYQRCG